MENEYLKKLEYNKIIETLLKFCNTNFGKALANSLIPNNNKEIVQNLLLETDEALNIIIKSSTPPIYGMPDMEIYLKILESFGVLPIKAILEFKNILKFSDDLKKYFYQEHINVLDFPFLNALFSALYTNSGIIQKISVSIIDENSISDNASPNLSSIRKKQRKLEQDIKNKLNDIIHSSKFSKYIQENVVTIRNDRYVIPVKEEYRSQIKGFVHDMSSTGSTVFIEPLSVFEWNNELNNLKVEENIEIEKILQNLSKLFYPCIEELKTDIETIGKLDFIFAKAKYAKSISATIPTISEKKEINLINARHPLLDKNKVVPINVNLGDTFSILLITGPNTGGKTVTLKTVGLLTCMACSGLAIPADEKSCIHIFDYIFADIGDNQSISDSLSTFSSHMLNIISILNTADDNSLVLVDELGSGTDPLEGANLAISILEQLQKLGTLVIATTHYPELKKYALVTDGFENASVEFDIDTLSPTYKLLVGIPGKSNAFAISQKLGLDNSIIQSAKSRMLSSDIDIEELLKSIYDNKSKIENEKEQIDKELEKIAILRKKLENDNSSIELKSKEIIQKAKVQARTILLEAKEDADEIIKEMNSSSNNKHLENSRNKLNSKLKSIRIINDEQDSATPNSLSASDLKIGVPVFVTTLRQNGIVLSHVSKSGDVQVQIGNIKMNIPIKNLQKNTTENVNHSSINTLNYTNISKTQNVNTEINVIGLNVIEALPIIDKFLDDASLAKLQTVRIVHGKGTGKLRDGIHQFLKKHPHVKNYRIGTFGEGEMGVTVVELK